MANIFKLGLIAWVGCCSSLAYAQQPPQQTPDAERYVDDVLVDTSALQAAIPDESKLNALQARIEADPRNLDHYFAYSQMATQLRLYDKSAGMYERMLQIAPNLPRVKLELAINYMQLQEHERAKALIDEVLQGDLPSEVKRNLEPIIAQIAEATKRHLFQGSVSMGLHYDTNANSAPRSGNVDVRFNNVPIEVTLNSAAQAQNDMQVFGVAQTEHYYRINDNVKDDTQYVWHNSITAYRNEYDTLDELNVSLAALRTGTIVSALENKLRLETNVGYSHITLERQTFQRHYLGEVTAQYALNATLRLQASSMITRRDFVNSDTNPTFELRDGYMRDHRIGLSYSLSKNDIVEAHTRYRREDTTRSFFDNHQYGLEAAYIHSFDNGMFTRAHADYNASYFDAADLSISTKTRKEYAAETGLTLGVPLTDEVTGTIAYQYRDVNSNIQNYDFDSHRVSTGINARF